MSQRPDESDEAREGMPTQAALFRRTARVRDLVAITRMAQAEIQAEAGEAPDYEQFQDWETHRDPGPLDKEGNVTVKEWTSGPEVPGYQTPAHVGMRSRLGVGREDSELVEADRYA